MLDYDKYNNIRSDDRSVLLLDVLVVLLTVATGLLVVLWLLVAVLCVGGLAVLLGAGWTGSLDDDRAWLLVHLHLFHVHHASSLSGFGCTDHDHHEECADTQPQHPSSKSGPALRAAPCVVLVVPPVECTEATVNVVVVVESTVVEFTAECHYLLI